MKHNTPTPSQLLELIDRYYECSLSDEEEASLRVEIANTDLRHPSIDEIRALMGVRLPSSSHVASDSRTSAATDLSHKHTYISVAAAIAVLLTTCMYPWLNPSSPALSGTDKCIAYSGGQLISDEADVMRLIADNLLEFESCIDEIHTSISHDLDDIAPIIETYEAPEPIL